MNTAIAHPAGEGRASMSKSQRPWGVNCLGSMISSNVYTEHHGRMVHAVPVAYHKNWLQAVRAAYWVMTGRAEAVVWPQPGELENALSGGFECGRTATPQDRETAV